VTREIPLSRGMVALVDDEDYDRVMAAGPWHARPSRRTCYAQHHVSSAGGRTTQQLHQFLTGHVGVDHVNGDGLDNRQRNLRPADQRQNSANRRRSSHNTSGYKGVTRKSRGGSWIAQIRVEGHQQHIGTYPTAADAARAYDAAALTAWGAFARPNFPQEI
jgi:hypothetical protein